MISFLISHLPYRANTFDKSFKGVKCVLPILLKFYFTLTSIKHKYKNYVNSCKFIDDKWRAAIKVVRMREGGGGAG